ncbi:MAG: class II fructose-bisphosphate aldolase [Bifidobacteriaceae bacterium]|jgi:fructose-bisphosphate aldolase class II|nr:class II fructose-bisphosphate aldolase [Bifidobacteriaceae bacterium]
MTLAHPGEIMGLAVRQGCGVGAFNVIQLELAEAIVEGAEAAGRPIFLQISQNCVRYHGALAPVIAACQAVARAAAVPVAVHLDHAESVPLVTEALELGVDSVMYDASRLSDEANMASTAAVADLAHARGAWIEAELGEIGGKDGDAVRSPGAPGHTTSPAAPSHTASPAVPRDCTGPAALGHAVSPASPGDAAIQAAPRDATSPSCAVHTVSPACPSPAGGHRPGRRRGAHSPGARTDAADAARFVEATGVDALAVAVGSAHAMTTRTAALDLELIARIRAAVDVPLVLHGSSGVPDADLAAAVRAGMTKINIATLLNQTFTGSVRATLAANPDLVDTRKYFAPARAAVAQAVASLLAVIP